MDSFKDQLNTQVTALLSKKMDRQDFIRHVAVGIVFLTGASTVLKLLAPEQESSSSTGYGGSTYRGTKE
ncbi:MAG TPA: hypothetical protein VMT96_01135 [Candidatus Bathyarchaeia archaeon]|nr:hypothetical protein [Candidatus Bathyarchaeia archaeon]